MKVSAVCVCMHAQYILPSHNFTSALCQHAMTHRKSTHTHTHLRSSRRMCRSAQQGSWWGMDYAGQACVPVGSVELCVNVLRNLGKFGSNPLSSCTESSNSCNLRALEFQLKSPLLLLYGLCLCASLCFCLDTRCNISVHRQTAHHRRIAALEPLL